MFNINDLVDGLLRSGNQLAREGKPELRSDGGGTTLRFDPELRRFLDAHSQAMGGASLQQVVSMILTGVMRASMAETAAMRVDRLRNRVFELFDRHGIDIPTMSEILQDFDCPLSRDALVERLDNKLLDQLTELFDVQREWLLAQEPYITPTWKNRWYRKSASFVAHVIDLDTQGLKPRVWMLTRGSFDADIWSLSGHQEGGNDVMVGIVVEVQRRTSKGTSFSTFENWGDEPWFHMPSRAEFRAIAKFLSDPPGEVEQTYAAALWKDYSYFTPRDDLDGRGIAVHPEVYDALYRHNTITVHEMLTAPRQMGAGWSLLECGRQFSGKQIEAETKEVWDNFSTIVQVLDRSRPWLPAEERPNAMTASRRSMEEIMAATKARKSA